MPRKRTGTAWTKTLIVRISERQDEDLRIAAEALGMDVSNLVRLLFTECVPMYMKRGEDAARQAEAARTNVSKPAATTRAKGKPASKAKPAESGDENVRNLEV